MQESFLERWGSPALGVIIAVPAILIAVCMYLSLAMSVVSFAAWWLPLTVVAVTWFGFGKRLGKLADFGGVIALFAAVLCAPWAMLLQMHPHRIPTRFTVLLGLGMSDEPVQGPRGPELHDLAEMNGFTLILSLGATVWLIVLAVNAVKRQWFGTELASRDSAASDSN